MGKREMMTIDKFKNLYVGKNGCRKDHLGNYYVSVWSMCDSWGVNRKTFMSRMQMGWSLERALTTDNSKVKPDKDINVIWVFGEPFPSYMAIDNAYGYSKNTSANHKDNLEEWLQSNNLYYVDKKLFRSFAALGIEYNISEYAIRWRLKEGWTLYEAVHIPIDERGKIGKPQKDHLGNEYETLGQMLKHYHMTYSCYYHRKNCGMSLEEILTKPVRNYLSNKAEKAVGNTYT